MVTKADLLKKLTVDQLREIAIANSIRVSEDSGKEEIIKQLLVLSMKSIRSYVAEYLDADSRVSTRGRKKPTYDLALRPEAIPVSPEFSEKIAEMTKDIRDLVQDKLKDIGLEDVSGKAALKLEQLESLERKLRRRARKNGDEIRRGEVKSGEPLEILPNRIATGCRDLDNLLLGGIPQNYAVVLSSGSCDERELLVRRFLERGMEDNHTTFHVATDSSAVKSLAEEYRSSFYLFLCNPHMDSTIANLPNVLKLKGVENLNEISIALSSAFRKLDEPSENPRRACLEIISDLLLHHHIASVRKWLTSLIPEFKSKGFTVLAVVNPLMHPPQETQAIIDLFDGEISIFEKETSRGPQKYLRIAKLYDKRYRETQVRLTKKGLKA